MNVVMADLLEKETHRFNSEIVNGFATKEIRTAPEYIDAIIRSSMRSATPLLEYHGYRILSPKEEYESLFTTGNNMINYDFAKSDLFNIELMLSYNNVRLKKRHLSFPFLDDGGLMDISDTTYHIIPVLSDTVISPNDKEVFVRLLRDKLTFKRLNYNILYNGKSISGDIIHSTIYRTTGRTFKDDLGSIVTPIALYMLADMGYEDTFLKYTGVKPIITYERDMGSYMGTHHIFESTKIKPSKLKSNNYIGHNVKILIPNDIILTPLITNLISGLMYTLDVNTKNSVEMVNCINSNDKSKETMFWKIMLGNIIFKNNYSADRVYADMLDHFVSLRSYIDDLIKEKLAEVSTHIENFSDLLAVILGQFSFWLLNHKTHSNNIFNRYLDVMYYILFDIILGINKTIFDISRKSYKKVLNDKEVARTLNSSLSKKKIYSIVKSSSVNITLLLLDYSGDCKYPKVTSVLELQERGKNVTKSKSAVFPKATRHIVGSDYFQGTMYGLNKKAPTPKIKINPFMTIDPITKRPLPTKEQMETIEILDRSLSGKLGTNSKIYEIEVEETDFD